MICVHNIRLQKWFKLTSTSQSTIMSIKNNLKPETRALIVTTGYQLRAVKNHNKGLPINTKTTFVSATDIRKAIGKDHNEGHDRLLGIKSVRRWWKKREEFEATGQLKPAPRSTL